MQEFDARQAIGALSYFVGQATALLSMDDPGMREALDRMISYHEANAGSPSASEVMNAVRLGSERMESAVRTGQVRRGEPQE